MSLNNQMPQIMKINYWQKYTMNNSYSYELIEFYSLHQILTPLEKRTGFPNYKGAIWRMATTMRNQKMGFLACFSTNARRL